jgi:hypothetical protein
VDESRGKEGKDVPCTASRIQDGGDKTKSFFCVAFLAFVVHAQIRLTSRTPCT